MTEIRQATYAAYIDVLDDGDFADAADDLSARLRADQGITVSTGKDSARPLAPPMVPSYAFELDNTDRELSPENAASDYYQLLIPDRTGRVQASYGDAVEYDAADVDYDAPLAYDGTTTTVLATGPIDNPEQHPERGQRSVGIRGLGTLARVRGVTISTHLYDAYNTGDAVYQILAACGIPYPSGMDLAVGDTTMAWWWVDNEDAFSALQRVLAAEGAGASIWEDGEGVIHFENRNYRLTETRSTDVQATFLDAPASGEVGFQSFRYDSGLKDIVNSVSMNIEARVEEALSHQWSYGGDLVLGANEVKVIDAYFSGGDPIANYAQLDAAQDYDVTAGSLVDSDVDLISATQLRITLTAGAAGCTITGNAADPDGFAVRLAFLRVAGRQTVTQSVAGSTLISNTIAKELVADTNAWPVLSEAEAQSVVDAYALYYRDPRPTVSIEVANRDFSALLAALSRQISDRVHITEDWTGLDRDCWVEQITHRVEAGRLHRVGLVCSVVLDADEPALWDEGLWDTGLWGI